MGLPKPRARLSSLYFLYNWRRRPFHQHPLLSWEALIPCTSSPMLAIDTQSVLLNERSGHSKSLGLGSHHNSIPSYTSSPALSLTSFAWARLTYCVHYGILFLLDSDKPDPKSAHIHWFPPSVAHPRMHCWRQGQEDLP